MITYLHAAGAWSSYLTERESATKETEQQTSILNIQVKVEDYEEKDKVQIWTLSIYFEGYGDQQWEMTSCEKVMWMSRAEAGGAIMLQGYIMRTRHER